WKTLLDPAKVAMLETARPASAIARLRPAPWRAFFLAAREILRGFRLTIVILAQFCQVEPPACSPPQHATMMVSHS
ncbi:MAG: hypothetical protein V2I43_22750, partial [Parvularcula sp.]|nr:hypothetical protein [Parvularcula sp.]